MGAHDRSRPCGRPRSAGKNDGHLDRNHDVKTVDTALGVVDSHLVGHQRGTGARRSDTGRQQRGGSQCAEIGRRLRTVPRRHDRAEIRTSARNAEQNCDHRGRDHSRRATVIAAARLPKPLWRQCPTWATALNARPLWRQESRRPGAPGPALHRARCGARHRSPTLRHRGQPAGLPRGPHRHNGPASTPR